MTRELFCFPTGLVILMAGTRNSHRPLKLMSVKHTLNRFDGCSQLNRIYFTRGREVFSNLKWYPVYFRAGNEGDMKRDIESCPLDGVNGTMTSPSCLFQPLVHNEHPEGALQGLETQTLSARQSGVPGQSVRELFCQSGPSSARVRDSRRQERAEHCPPAHWLCRPGAETRRNHLHGAWEIQFSCSFLVTALTGATDVLISGLRICLNSLCCALGNKTDVHFPFCERVND